MVIQLSEYRKAKAVQTVTQRRDDELLCVNWNPAFGVVAVNWYQPPQELSPALPDAPTDVDPAVMDRIYALASQI